MPKLEFVDCPRCGKRVAKTAKICHHCERLRNRSNREADDENSEAHHSTSNGGYDSSQDDFDYDEFLSEEFPDSLHHSHERNRWRYVSILLLVVFLLLFLVQFL